MAGQKTREELNKLSKQDLITLVLSMQEQLDRLNTNLEKLIEQIRIADQQRFGRKSEKLDVIDGQLSLFDEAEVTSDNTSDEQDIEEVISRKARKKKKKGQREEDLKDLPEEVFVHELSDAQLNAKYGEGNWRRMGTETYKRLRYTPASWSVEIHKVDVAVGKSGDLQDEFTRGDRPADLFRNSIVTPSLLAAILNGKYVNAIPLYRIEQQFQRDDIHISRQSMANWVIWSAKRYFTVLYDRLKEELLKYHVNQADETPCIVSKDGRPAGSKSYMWVHRSGEFYRDKPIVLYEYQKTRHHKHPEEFYRGYTGVLVTDGLQQYHMLENLLPGLISANCWAHARRDFADACKAIGSSNQEAIKKSTAYQALARIAAIYKIEEGLSDLTPEERLRERKKSVKPLVDEYFAWARERLSDTTVLPKGKTASGLQYSLNQEKYLRVFLDDGEIPIDNSASERSIRPFCIGKKNWVLIDSLKGAEASATVYSIAETAKLNNLHPYYYFDHLLTVLPQYIDVDKDGDIDATRLKASTLEDLLPWSKALPAKCYKGRR